MIESGGVVVSGLAAGIDTAAHRGAMEAGGKTIAVLGTPLDVSYPKENSGLQEIIARDHLVVSQFAPGSKTIRASFPIRNRTMALLTDATVIVEAGESSGTLHQGWEAISHWGGRCSSWSRLPAILRLSWPGEMVKYGAQVLTRENLDIVIENLPEFAHADAASF